MLHPRFLLAFLTGALLVTASPAFAQTGDTDQRREEARKLADGLHYQKGNVPIKGGLAKINVPEEFRFLDPADSKTVLSKIWGNPPDDSVLGMLLPAQVSPADSSAWAIVISYEEEGFVKDDDAATINYDDLLKKMREQTAAGNQAREKQGYSTVELVGWAEQPRYDKATHKLYWAKELKFGGEGASTLNYDIRMLGRRGVLVLTAVSAMDRLPEIEQATPAILQMVDFQEGHRYTDFNPSTDKVATYGLAALIAGGVLAKAGFFKLLIAGALAAKKFVIVGIVALISFIKKIFGGKREQT